MTAPRCWTCSDYLTRPHSHEPGSMTRERRGDAIVISVWNARGEVGTEWVLAPSQRLRGGLYVSVIAMDDSGRSFVEARHIPIDAAEAMTGRPEMDSRAIHRERADHARREAARFP